jgi:uncharacterized membrane protein YkgB
VLSNGSLMTAFISVLVRLGLLKEDLDYHLIRAAMVIMFLFFGYQKWFEYEAQTLIPYISNGPLISWLYPVFGIRGASWFLGVAEWTFGAVLTFISTVTIIPFMPNGWEPSAGGFPAMVGNVPFLMKDVVPLAVSIYLLKQDVVRVMVARFTRGVAHAPARTV